MLYVFFFSDGNGLQIISLIRLAFGGHVTFVFSYIETSQESMPSAWLRFAAPASGMNSGLVLYRDTALSHSPGATRSAKALTISSKLMGMITSVHAC